MNERSSGKNDSMLRMQLYSEFLTRQEEGKKEYRMKQKVKRIKER